MNLTDGPWISGATTPTLTLRRMIDAGPYDVVITDECSSTVSQAARINLCPAAVGSIDGNGDGLVNARDIALFITAVLNREPASISALVYDLTADGIVDLADLDPFVSRLLAP